MSTLATTRPWQLLRTALHPRADVPAPVSRPVRRRRPRMFMTATPPSALDLDLRAEDVTDGLRGL